MCVRCISCVITTLLSVAGAAFGQVPGSGPQGPIGSLDGGPTVGRVVWLRADSNVTRGPTGLVQKWGDSTGTWNPFFSSLNGESEPEWLPIGIGGQPALQFDGNDWLLGAGMPIGSYTKVVVCQLDDLSFTNNVVSSVYHHALWFGATPYARLFHSGDLVQSSVAVTAGKPFILVASYDAANGRAELYLDRQLVGRASSLNGNWDSTLLLGSFAYGNFMKGRIAEVSIYDHALDTTELGQLHDYLQQRYFDPGVAHVRWDAVPRPGQVLQRDAANQAVLALRGWVTSPGWSDLLLEIARDGVPWLTKSKALTYGANGEALFVLSPQLMAGLHNHDIELFVRDATRKQRIASIPAVTVGDVYVINGQSNAVAPDIWGEQLGNRSQSEWIRTFGSASTVLEPELDFHWDQGEGNLGNSHASVGQWGLRLGEYLLDHESVPIALLNGAVGGTTVAQHQRNDSWKIDPTTIYGRLLHRLIEAGVSKEFKALLWYQGESDAGNASNWKSGWDDLRSDWASDFPALQRVYLVQIRNDCAGGGKELKEVQRVLQDTDPDITVMSTTAVPGHDGCHYYNAGYRDLGEKLARLVRRDFYGSTDTRAIDPPNPLSAKWLYANHKRLAITFRDPNDALVCEVGAEADFVTDDGVRGNKVVITGNVVTIDLVRRSNGSSISYRGHAFDGPWFRNSRGVGALCFEGLPIQ